MSKPLKIIITSSTFPASKTDKTPRFVEDQILAFNNRYPDMSITVLAPHSAYIESAPTIDHPSYKEVRYHYFWPHRFEKLAGRGIGPALKENPLRYILVPFLLIGQYLALSKLIKADRPDYIYAHWFMPQGIIAALLSEKHGISWLLTSHANDIGVLNKLPLIGQRIVQKYLPTAQKITFVSRRTELKARGFFDKKNWDEVIAPKTKIIPMGVALATKHIKNDRLTKAPSELLFIGRLSEKKGVKYLLEAFSRIDSSKFSKLRLTIAGDGQLMNDLQVLNSSINVDRDVNFLGYISGKSKLNTLGRADVLILPSVETSDGDAEGMPVGLMEGLARGKICIASDVSGAEEILEDGVNGYLFKAGNAEQLSDKIQYVLSLNKSDRKNLSENARSTAELFDWERIIKQHYSHLFDSF